MADELGLKLTAQITEWVGNMDKAAKAADRLLTVVKEVEKGIQAAFAGIEAAAKQSLGKSAAAFVNSAVQIDKAAQAIEQDATKAGKALDGVGKAAQRSARVIDGAAKDIGRSAKGIGDGAQDAARNLGSGFAGVESQFKAVSDRVSGAVLNIRNAVLGLGALRFGQAAVDSASDFEAALGQLAIVSADTGKPIADLRQQLLDLSKTTPQALGDLTKAYATAVGSLPKGANQAQVAFEALDAAQKAARASGATTEETLRGITALLNTYGDTGLTAAQITDKLFATFDQGAATVPELTASIGQVAGIAKGFGISIDEVFGSIAVLTRGGQTASEAITNLRQALISAARPPKIVKDELEALGVSADLFSAQSLRTNGLIGVLEQVEKAGGTNRIEKLFTDTQGLLAVQTLLSKGLAQTRDDIARVGDSAGKTDAAVATIAGNFDQLAGIAKNRLGAALIDIGERIMPTVARALGQLADFAEKNGAQIAEGIGKAVDVLVRFGTWVVEFGPEILLFFGSLKVTSFFAGLARDVGTATTALVGFVQQYRAAAAIGAGLAGVGAGAQPVVKTRIVFDPDGTTREIQDVVNQSGPAAAKGGAAIGEKFSSGFTGKLKSLGPAISGIIRSPGMLGLVVGAGVFLGEALGDAIGKAAADAIEGPIQREIEGNIRDLDRRLKAALAARGAASQEELDAAEQRRRRGEVVDVGGRGDIREFKTLADVAAAGGDVSGAAVQGLEGLEKDRQRITASLNRLRAANEEAVADLEHFNQVLQAPELADPGAARVAAGARSRIEVARLGGSLEGREQRVAETKKDVEDAEKALQDLSAAMSKVGAESDRLGQATAEGVVRRTKEAAQGAKKEADTFLADLVAAYEAAQSKLAALRLAGQRQIAEAMQSEAEALKATFEAETDARVNALEDADVKESQVAELRAQRERDFTAILDYQILALQKVAKVRADEARAAAAQESQAFREGAEERRLIAQNLAREEAAIQAQLAQQTEELRRASSVRISAAEREASKKRAEEAIRQQEIAAEVNRARSVSGRIGGVVGALQDPLGALQNAASRARARGPNEAGSAIDAALPALGEVGAIIAVVKDLPNILNGIAGLLTDGIDNFVDSLFDSILNVATSLAFRLPGQIDRLLTQTVPRFVEKLIAALPQIVGGLVALLPELVGSLAEALAVALPVALYDGFVQAGKAIANAIAEFFTGSSTGEKVGAGIGAGGGAIAGGILGAAGGPLGIALGAALGAGIGGYVGNKLGGLIDDIFHDGGVVGEHSNPHMAAAIAAGGAPRFANGGMVTGVGSLARRRLSQILSGDDVPALLAPGEGVLTARGVEAVGGPTGVESINRGNGPAGGTAQLTISGRVGGDAALAALVARLVSISISSPQGNVRMAMNRSQLATTIPGWAPLKPA